MGIRAVHLHMKDPFSEKLNKRTKNMKLLSSIKKYTFAHLVIPKDLPKSGTSKETVEFHNVADVSSCSTSHRTLVLAKLSFK